MKITRNTKSHLLLTGNRANGISKSHGIVGYTISNSYKRQRKQLFTTGKPGKSTKTIMIKNPFIVSQYLPNTLLCAPCGRSTFTLTLTKVGKNYFMQTKCANCGNSGQVGLRNLKGTKNSSRIQDFIVAGARTQRQTVDRVGSNE